MPKIGVIGAGQVGATTTFLLLKKNLGNIVLLDINEDLAKGKILDMQQAAVLWQSSQRVTATVDYAQLVGAEVVVITAGFPRKPGMSRLELIEINSQIVSEIITKLSSLVPTAKIIIVTNPLDVMVYLALANSDYAPAQLLGMSSLLDTARFKYFISRELGVKAREISAMVIGAHDDTMVPLVSLCKVAGSPLSTLLSQPKIDKIVAATKAGGAQIVSLLKTGGAFYAPAEAIVEMIEAILNNSPKIIPACVLADGKYGLKDVCLGLPVKLGQVGVKEIVELPISEQEQKLLKDSASQLQAVLKQLPKVVREKA
jgi:malate dehydrogenase